MTQQTKANGVSLNQQLRDLPVWGQVAFATVLSERMAINYQLFAEGTSYGHPEVLRTALDALWSALAHKKKVNTERWLEKLEPEIPDFNQFDSWGVFPALEAITALCATLNIAADPEAAEVVEVSRLSRNGVKEFILLQEGDDVDLRQHPLMQYEFAYQQALLDALLGQRHCSASLIAQLKDEFLAEPVSNLGIELES